MLQGNPLNTFQWKLVLFGTNPLSEIEIQKVTPPSLEIQPIEVGAGTHNIEYPGKIKVGDLVCEGLKIGITGLIDPIYQWLKSCQDFDLGSMPPLTYRKSGQLILLGSDLITRVKMWEMSEVWPKKFELPELDLKANELYIEKITFSVRKFKQIL